MARVNRDPGTRDRLRRMRELDARNQEAAAVKLANTPPNEFLTVRPPAGRGGGGRPGRIPNPAREEFRERREAQLPEVTVDATRRPTLAEERAALPDVLTTSPDVRPTDLDQNIQPVTPALEPGADGPGGTTLDSEATLASTGGLPAIPRPADDGRIATVLNPGAGQPDRVGQRSDDRGDVPTTLGDAARGTITVPGGGTIPRPEGGSVQVIRGTQVSFTDPATQTEFAAIPGKSFEEAREASAQQAPGVAELQEIAFRDREVSAAEATSLSNQQLANIAQERLVIDSRRTVFNDETGKFETKETRNGEEVTLDYATLQSEFFDDDEEWEFILTPNTDGTFEEQLMFPDMGRMFNRKRGIARKLNGQETSLIREGMINERMNDYREAGQDVTREQVELELAQEEEAALEERRQAAGQ